MEYEYRDLKSHTAWLCRLLYTLAALDVASLFSTHHERGVLHRIADMTAENAESIRAAAERSDFWQKLIAYPQLGLSLLTFVLAGMWIYRSAANVRALGAEGLKFTPGWSVGWYAVPLANLFKPFHAMDEIWRASLDPHAWNKLPTPPDLRVWWGLWLASCVLGRIVMQMSFHAEKIDELLDVNMFQTVSDLVSLPLNLLFAHIVIRIAHMQAGHPEPAQVPQALSESA